MTWRLAKKIQRVPMTTNWWVPLIVVLVLLPRIGLAVAGQSLGEQIFDAAKRGDLTSIKTLLANGANVNTRDKHGSTPLIWAAGYNQRDAVKLLLQRGADVNARSAAGETALIEAARYGNTEVARLLLAKGADLNMRDASGWNALRHAATEKHAETVNVLRAHGANVSLIIAAILGDLKDIERLILSGADLNEQDERGSTPLIEAIRHENVGVVKLLLDHGADPNKKDNADNTALMMAGLTGQLDVVKLLLSKGADLNARNINGWTALSYTGAEHKAVRRFLTEAGAVDQWTDPYGRARTKTLAEKRRKEKFVTGKLVKCSAGEITIQVSDEKPSDVMKLALSSSTVFAPFRRPRAGDKVRVRYSERGGRKVADQVKILLGK